MTGSKKTVMLIYKKDWKKDVGNSQSDLSAMEGFRAKHLDCNHTALLGVQPRLSFYKKYSDLKFKYWNSLLNCKNYQNLVLICS